MNDEEKKEALKRGRAEEQKKQSVIICVICGQVLFLFVGLFLF